MFDLKINKIHGWGALLAGCILFPFFSHGFPPAPHHTFLGTVRDELGRPLEGENVEVLMESSAGKVVQGDVYARALPGINYTLKVPMDAGITEDLYQPTAMRPTMPFLIRVRVGNRVYLPIEMAGDFSRMGEPGQKTRLDLTLGEDADGDGLPDAWERSLLGKGQGLEDIKPGDDSDGDGMSNLNEYISGNYAFDKEDGFTLKIVEQRGGDAVLEFMAIRGRTYSVHRSGDLKEWEQAEFGMEQQEGALKYYRAEDVRKLRVTVPNDEGSSSAKFYKLMVQ
jgi:hypothetical protein